MRQLLAVLFSLPLVPAAVAQSDRAELENFTFEKIEFVAPSLEGKWGEAGVYLPKGYADEANAEKRYPWTIWLHGMNGNYRRFHSGGADVLDELRGSDAIPDMIFVAVSAGRRSAYFNGERSGNYEDLVMRDLFTHMEENYRVSDRREHRAIMGISIGGFGAMRFAFKRPDLFGAVAAHSSAVPPADPDDMPERYQRMASRLGLDPVLGNPIDAERWAKEIPAAMVAGMKPETLDGLRIYFDVGTNDRYRMAGPNQTFHESLEEAGIDHTFQLLEGGGHSWGSGFPREALEASLKFVGDSMQRTDATDTAPAGRQG